MDHASWTRRLGISRRPAFSVVEVFYLSRPVRVVAAVASFGAGLITSLALARLPVWSYTGVLIFAISLAVALGLGKTTTACGLNALVYLGGPTAPGALRAHEAFAYIAASTVTAALIGASLGWLGQITNLQGAALLATVPLALFGLIELSLIRLRFIPSIRWQVPAAWVRGRRAAPVIWGVLLGTGLSTWMPFPSYLGLLIFATFAPVPAGAVLMATYGLGRAAPALGVLGFGSGVVDRVTEHVWQLRLVTHCAAGCLTLALCGTVVGALR
jgi:hypothetical protein